MVSAASTSLPLKTRLALLLISPVTVMTPLPVMERPVNIVVAPTVEPKATVLVPFAMPSV